MDGQYGAPLIRKREYTHFYTYFLMVYFLLAPFEDILTSGIGTLGKYLAVLIVLLGIFESSNRIRISLRNGNMALMYLMVLGLVSCAWAIDRNIAVGRNAAYLMLTGFYLFVDSLDFSQKEYEKIVYSAVLGGAVAAVYILVNNYTAGNGRMQLSEDNDPNNLAALIQLPLAMTFRLVMKKETKMRAVYVAIIALLSLVLLLTGSRGGMFSAVVFFLSFLVLSKAYKKAGMLFGLVVVAIIIWSLVLPALPEYISDRLFQTDYNAELDHGNRTRIWRVVVRGLLKQMPSYGVGAGCAPQALLQWLTYVKGVHNTYLNMVCEYGFLGIAFFVWFLWVKLKAQIKLGHHTETALMLAMYVTIFFLDSFAKKFFWNVMMLTAIADKAAQNQALARSDMLADDVGQSVDSPDDYEAQF